MRRISLALALVGAVAATGCGGAYGPATSGDGKGTAGVDFTVTINNQGPGAITGSMTCAANTKCTQTFASGTTVTLNAAPTGSNYFNGWFGGCQGTDVCTLTGGADQYVVAYFSATPQAHANWAGGHPLDSGLACNLCHQADQNVGLAPACNSCHGKPAADGTVLPAIADGKSEACSACHGKAGSEHQARFNAYADGINQTTTQFAVSNVSLAITDSATAGKKKATVTFTLAKGGQPFTGGGAALKQKTIYFVSYDATAKKFPTPAYLQTADVDPDGTIGKQDGGSIVNFSFGSMTATATPGVYTMVKDGLSADPVAAATNAFLYGYFGDANVPTLEGNLNPGGRHYALMDNMVSFSKLVKGAIDYTSTATVSGCERCHGAPYSKHGYRQAAVAGLNDFVACKACHTDFRRGTDAGWYLPIEIPGYAGEAITDAQKLQFAYTANIMQDTHNSHAFEFAYPQTMANCTTCHEGKLDRVLTDANFVGTVCKSCHATTNPKDIAKRAPSFAGPVLGPKLAYHAFNWVDVYDANHVLVGPAGTIKHTDGTTGAVTYMQCYECHSVDPATGTNRVMYGNVVPLFKDIHSGKIASVYAADGSKYAATAKAQIDSVNVDTAAKTVTVTFSVTGAPADATIKPTVVGGLYGFGTKDFIVSGHGSAADGKRVLEWADGSTSNSPRLTVTGSGPWTAVADLSDPVAFKAFADGWATKMELGILPAVTLTDGTSIAITGVTGTIDLTVNGAGTLVANQYGKAIVDSAKCNKCHEALGTEFHSPSYGSAGVVGCRLCHYVGSASSHFELQSRSIDSFIHAAHSFQKMDLTGPRGGPVTNWADPAVRFEYEEHINSVYPNFSIQNCESCHNPGTYDVPDQAKSLPGLISGSTEGLTGWTRNITGLKAVATGPAARACGACHRVPAIKEDNLTELNAFNAHTAEWGIWQYKDATGAAATYQTLSDVIAELKADGIL